MNYDDFQVADAPSWLSDAAGQLWSRMLGTMKNAFLSAATSAVMARFASTAPVDALPLLLEDRQLDPAWNESEDSIRRRIIRAWATWSEAGRPESLKEALRLAGYTNFQIREANVDPSLASWQFEVWLYPPFPWTEEHLADGLWGDPGVWDDGGVFSGEMPPDHAFRIRGAIRKWPGLHMRCRAIVVVHGGETWDATPGATWDDTPSATWGDAVSYVNP